ncbi:MAG: DUF3185 domain-containing protein [Vicinamibacteraceae bacterium]|nr:DUF3185 domain-containing protein [Vicinamibacteraceae bacterium]
MRIAGIILIVLGLAALALQGLSFTRKETVLDAGPVEVSRSTRETIPLPPIVGIVAVVAGLGLVYAGRTKK